MELRVMEYAEYSGCNMIAKKVSYSQNSRIRDPVDFSFMAPLELMPYGRHDVAS